jgi:aldose sugar dehydrogenase
MGVGGNRMNAARKHAVNLAMIQTVYSRHTGCTGCRANRVTEAAVCFATDRDFVRRMMHSCRRLLLLLPCCAALAGGAEPAGVEEAEIIRRWDPVYQRLCATCHGADRQGGLGGSLVDGKWRRGGTPEQLRHSIAAGWEKTGMPEFGSSLAPAEIDGLVEYIRVAHATHQRSQAAKAERAPDGARESGGVRFVVETVAAPLETPWSVAWLPDGRMLVTERPGRLRVLARDGRLGEPVVGIPEVFAEGQGGLLDVAVHPDYVRNGWIYLSYSEPRVIAGERRAFTAIVRGKVRDGRWREQETIFRAPDRFYNDSAKHWGCRLVFDGAGHLFFGIGERGDMARAQDPADPAGKIHRIHDDGRVPADNPFHGRAGHYPTIWALGVRNPQGLLLDRERGLLWETEHGPRGGDELNLIKAGANYGWAVVSRGRNYNFAPVRWARSAPGIEEPRVEWTPSIGASGLEVYRGDAFPAWRGQLLAGGLALEELHRVVIAPDGSARPELLLKGLGRVRDVRVGPDGFIYVVLNQRREQLGRIVRLRPVP